MHQPRELSERFWEKVNKTETCWLWIAGLGTTGYGHFYYKDGKYRKAHRVAYELTNNVILNEDLHIHHKCENPLCVNPAHLVLTTNVGHKVLTKHYNAKKTHCKRGHEFTPENTKILNRGQRCCIACQHRKR